MTDDVVVDDTQAQLIKWAGIGLGVLLFAWLVYSCSGGEETATFRVESVDYEVENPASLRVFVEVENTGEVLGSPSCKINASDPSGAYRGFDTFDAEPVAPGEVGSFFGSLVIRDEGAAFVDDVTVVCS